MNLNKIRNITLIVALLILFAGLGYNYGKNDTQKLYEKYNASLQNSKEVTSNNSYNIDFNLFWTVWDKLHESYYNKAKLIPEKMYNGAISGMVQALGDPYTVFLTPDQNKETKQELSGTFEGIGAQLGIKDKKIVVIAPLSDSPAEKAGLKTGDWIISINGEDTGPLSLPEAVSKIRGPKNTKVKLTILHENDIKPVDVEINRDNILIKSVELSYKNDIAILKLSQFGDNSNAEWDKAVTDIVAKGSSVKGVVLDLRNNPGGYLNGSVYIASEFIKSGLVVIQDSGNGDRQNYDVDRRGRLTDKPLVVLVNKGSASASEIVAGALQDYSRAKLVGVNSFGKGTIQDAQDLDNGAGLHITVAKWLTPKKRWINDTGLTVDINVPMDEKNPTVDPQLDKALELLR